jgi:GDPmannose 4,6-dehydratase
MRNKKTALVLGIGGQDAAYLSLLLLSKGYNVVGTSRDATLANRVGLATLGIESQVKIVSMAPTDFRSVLQTVRRHAPDEVYHLAGQTSVGLSFDQPVETIESIAIGTLNVLEAIRFVERPIRLYHAGSSECFGDTGDTPANESTPFRPRSPYAVAKACAHNLVANYREAYGMHACTGILFNHESPLRPERFVTQKIVRAAARIAAGSLDTLKLGNLEVHRDWGWAPEYVDAMWRMVQQTEPEDLVIATGRTVSLRYFVDRAFRFFGLDCDRHLVSDDALLRPSDIRYGAGSPARALEKLDWRSSLDIDGVVDALCADARDALLKTLLPGPAVPCAAEPLRGEGKRGDAKPEITT